MFRFLIAALLASMLAGCAIVPLDYGYRDGGYRHHQHDYYRGDRPHYWR